MDFIVNDDSLDETLVDVERVRNWSPRVISKLENFIHTADDEKLFRISPLQWASEKNVDEHEAIDLFLHSAKAGLFYMDWNVMCSCCGKITQSFHELHSVQAVSTCKLCFQKDLANLDDSVQITFTLSPSIRSLRYHHPETLSLEDYCFNYLFEPSTIVAGMMTLRDAFLYTKRHFSTFFPGEKITVETDVGIGILSCMDLFAQQSFGLVVSGKPTSEVQKIIVRLTDAGFEVPLPKMQPGEFNVGSLVYAGTFYSIHPGKVRLEFEHDTSIKGALLVSFFPTPVDGVEGFQLPSDLPIEHTPEMASFFEQLQEGGADQFLYLDNQYSTLRLSARRLFASQTFHDLFRAEVFRESDGFGIKDVILLFTDLKSSTQLYQQIGDLNAFALVREHYGVLNTAILKQHGVIVKTIGDAIMATFNQPVDAVGAGLEMLKGLQRMNQASHYGDLILKIGIHRGAAISVTLNERIDYFGQTVNIAARVQMSAGGNEIYLTEAIYTSPGVLELLNKYGCSIQSAMLQLKGVAEQVKIYKITCPI
jgi:class 3 adenylate cyclase